MTDKTNNTIQANRMNADQIRAAVTQGKEVCWQHSGYRVVKDATGQYLIKCTQNNSSIGLTWADGQTLNGNQEDFFIL